MPVCSRVYMHVQFSFSQNSHLRSRIARDNEEGNSPWFSTYHMRILKYYPSVGHVVLPRVEETNWPSAVFHKNPATDRFWQISPSGQTKLSHFLHYWQQQWLLIFFSLPYCLCIFKLAFACPIQMCQKTLRQKPKDRDRVTLTNTLTIICPKPDTKNRQLYICKRCVTVGIAMAVKSFRDCMRILPYSVILIPAQ